MSCETIVTKQTDDRVRNLYVNTYRSKRNGSYVIQNQINSVHVPDIIFFELCFDLRLFNLTLSKLVY